MPDLVQLIYIDNKKPGLSFKTLTGILSIFLASSYSISIVFSDVLEP
jgi:hypothetical protein